MMLSKEPKATLLIKANTTSVWDNCDFVLIEIDKQWLELVQKRLEILTAMNDESLYAQLYWEAPFPFYAHWPEEYDDLRQFLDSEDLHYCFCEISKQERDSFTRPENMLICHQMLLSTSGILEYHAIGKHTDETFWTTGIDVAEIAKTITAIIH